MPRNHRGAMAPVLIALSFVTVLAFTAGTMTLMQTTSIKRAADRLAASGGFYPAEIAAVSNIERLRVGLDPVNKLSASGRVVAALGLTYSSSVSRSPGSCSGGGPGMPYSLGCTRNQDSGASLTQGFRGTNLTYEPTRYIASTQQHCATLEYSEKLTIRTCLAEPRDMYDFLFLDSVGRTVHVVFETDTQSFSKFEPLAVAPNLPNPRLDSAKYNGTTRRDYFLSSSIILDAATDEVGDHYLLLSDGRIVRSTAPGTAIHTDPKIVSITFNDTWYYLRSDGAVFVGSDDLTEAGDSDVFKEIEGLRIPTARALVTGSGPATPSI